MVTRFGYNEYMPRHYTFMMKVRAEEEPRSFIESQSSSASYSPKFTTPEIDYPIYDKEL